MRPRLPLHLPFAGGAQPDHSLGVKLFRVTSERREYSIQADLNRLKEARDFGERVAEEFGLPPEARYQVKLALSEAVTNAIQHGSSSPRDPVRIVVIRLGWNPRASTRGLIDRMFVPRETAPPQTRPSPVPAAPGSQ